MYSICMNPLHLVNGMHMWLHVCTYTCVYELVLCVYVLSVAWSCGVNMVCIGDGKLQYSACVCVFVYVCVSHWIDMHHACGEPTGCMCVCVLVIAALCWPSVWAFEQMDICYASVSLQRLKVSCWTCTMRIPVTICDIQQLSLYCMCLIIQNVSSASGTTQAGVGLVLTLEPGSGQAIINQVPATPHACICVSCTHKCTYASVQ